MCEPVRWRTRSARLVFGAAGPSWHQERMADGTGPCRRTRCLRTGEGGRESSAELQVAANSERVLQGPSQQQCQKIAAGGLDDRRCRRRGICRMGFDGPPVHRHLVRGPVHGHEQPRPVERVIELVVIGSPDAESSEPGRQRSPYEGITPIIQPDVQIRAVYLHFGQPQQRQTGQWNSSEIRVVLGFTQFHVPRSIVDRSPQSIQFSTQAGQRPDDGMRVFTRLRYEGAWTLHHPTLWVIGGLLPRETGRCHPQQRCGPETEMAGDGEPTPPG